MRLAFLAVVLFFILSLLWLARGHRLRPLDETTHHPWPPEVARWLEAGLLTREQAEAIVAFEDRRESPRKVSLLTEALG